MHILLLMLSGLLLTGQETLLLEHTLLLALVLPTVIVAYVYVSGAYLLVNSSFSS